MKKFLKRNWLTLFLVFAWLFLAVAYTEPSRLAYILATLCLAMENFIKLMTNYLEDKRNA